MLIRKRSTSKHKQLRSQRPKKLQQAHPRRNSQRTMRPKSSWHFKLVQKRRQALKLKNLRRKKALRFRRRTRLVAIKRLAPCLLSRRLRRRLPVKLPRCVHKNLISGLLSTFTPTTIIARHTLSTSTVGAVRYYSRGGKLTKNRRRQRLRKYKKQVRKSVIKRVLHKRFLRRRRRIARRFWKRFNKPRWVRLKYSRRVLTHPRKQASTMRGYTRLLRKRAQILNLRFSAQGYSHRVLRVKAHAKLAKTFLRRRLSLKSRRSVRRRHRVATLRVRKILKRYHVGVRKLRKYNKTPRLRRLRKRVLRLLANYNGFCSIKEVADSTLVIKSFERTLMLRYLNRASIRYSTLAKRRASALLRWNWQKLITRVRRVQRRARRYSKGKVCSRKSIAGIRRRLFYRPLAFVKIKQQKLQKKVRKIHAYYRARVLIARLRQREASKKLRRVFLEASTIRQASSKILSKFRTRFHYLQLIKNSKLRTCLLVNYIGRGQSPALVNRQSLLVALKRLHLTRVQASSPFYKANRHRRGLHYRINAHEIQAILMRRLNRNYSLQAEAPYPVDQSLVLPVSYLPVTRPNGRVYQELLRAFALDQKKLTISRARFLVNNIQERRRTLQSVTFKNTRARSVHVSIKIAQSSVWKKKSKLATISRASYRKLVYPSLRVTRRITARAASLGRALRKHWKRTQYSAPNLNSRAYFRQWRRLQRQYKFRRTLHSDMLSIANQPVNVTLHKVSPHRVKHLLLRLKTLRLKHTSRRRSSRKFSSRRSPYRTLRSKRYAASQGKDSRRSRRSSRRKSVVLKSTLRRRLHYSCFSSTYRRRHKMQVLRRRLIYFFAAVGRARRWRRSNYLWARRGQYWRLRSKLKWRRKKRAGRMRYFVQRRARFRIKQLRYPRRTRRLAWAFKAPRYVKLRAARFKRHRLILSKKLHLLVAKPAQVFYSVTKSKKTSRFPSNALTILRSLLRKTARSANKAALGKVIYKPTQYSLRSRLRIKPTIAAMRRNTNKLRRAFNKKRFFKAFGILTSRRRAARKWNSTARNKLRWPATLKRSERLRRDLQTKRWFNKGKARLSHNAHAAIGFSYRRTRKIFISKYGLASERHVAAVPQVYSAMALSRRTLDKKMHHAYKAFNRRAPVRQLSSQKGRFVLKGKGLLPATALMLFKRKFFGRAALRSGYWARTQLLSKSGATRRSREHTVLSRKVQAAIRAAAALAKKQNKVLNNKLARGLPYFLFASENQKIPATARSIKGLRRFTNFSIDEDINSVYFAWLRAVSRHAKAGQKLFYRRSITELHESIIADIGTNKPRFPGRGRRANTVDAFLRASSRRLLLKHTLPHAAKRVRIKNSKSSLLTRTIVRGTASIKRGLLGIKAFGYLTSQERARLNAHQIRSFQPIIRKAKTLIAPNFTSVHKLSALIKQPNSYAVRRRTAYTVALLRTALRARFFARRARLLRKAVLRRKSTSAATIKPFWIVRRAARIARRASRARMYSRSVVKRRRRYKRASTSQWGFSQFRILVPRNKKRVAALLTAAFEPLTPAPRGYRSNLKTTKALSRVGKRLHRQHKQHYVRSLCRRFRKSQKRRGRWFFSKKPRNHSRKTSSLVSYISMQRASARLGNTTKKLRSVSSVVVAPLHFKKKSTQVTTTAYEKARLRLYKQSSRQRKYRRLATLASSLTKLYTRLIGGIVNTKMLNKKLSKKEATRLVRSVYWNLRVYLSRDFDKIKFNKKRDFSAQFARLYQEITSNANHTSFSLGDLRTARYRFQPQRLHTTRPLARGAERWMRQFMPFFYDLYLEDPGKYGNLYLNPAHVFRAQPSSDAMRLWGTKKIFSTMEKQFNRLTTQRFEGNSSRFENMLITSRRTPVIAGIGAANITHAANPVGSNPARNSFFSRKFSTTTCKLKTPSTISTTAISRFATMRRYALSQEHPASIAATGVKHRILKSGSLVLKRTQRLRLGRFVGTGSIDVRLSRAKSPRTGEFLQRVPSLAKTSGQSLPFIAAKTSLNSNQDVHDKTFHAYRTTRTAVSPKNKSFKSASYNGRSIQALRSNISTRRVPLLGTSRKLLLQRASSRACQPRLRIDSTRAALSNALTVISPTRQALVAAITVARRLQSRQSVKILNSGVVSHARSMVQKHRASQRLSTIFTKRQPILLGTIPRLSVLSKKRLLRHRFGRKLRLKLLRQVLTQKKLSKAALSYLSKHTPRSKKPRAIWSKKFPIKAKLQNKRFFKTLSRGRTAVKVRSRKKLFGNIKARHVGRQRRYWRRRYRKNKFRFRRVYRIRAKRSKQRRQFLHMRFRLPQNKMFASSIYLTRNSGRTYLATHTQKFAAQKQKYVSKQRAIFVASTLKRLAIKRSVSKRFSLIDTRAAKYPFNPLRRRLWALLTSRRNKKFRFVRNWIRVINYSYKQKIWKTKRNAYVIPEALFKFSRLRLRKLEWRESDEKFYRRDLRHGFSFNPRERKNARWLEALLLRRAIHIYRRGEYRRYQLPREQKHRKWLQRLRKALYGRKLSNSFVRRRRWPTLRLYNQRLSRGLFDIRNSKASLKRFRKLRRTRAKTSGQEHFMSGMGNRLDVNLVLLNIAPTTFWAREVAPVGLLKVNGAVITDPAFLLQPQDYIEFNWSKIKRLKTHFRQAFKKTALAYIFKDTSVRFPGNFEYNAKLRSARYLCYPRTGDISPSSRLNEHQFKQFRLDSGRGA